ncbi:Uncharacterised protein [Sphingobacterium spiritivorum]|uniref:Uncharacterized protein n=1 Tax=Sphingobacterium spiritivorum TaxID=258 RepID=A0A380CEH1_SPHSI|nr:hypothetical protein [Sphingobacterium spiritivorum]SUJ19115.1 Uncharacterised protein [Sphingobacterium spiritivorum]
MRTKSKNTPVINLHELVEIAEDAIKHEAIKLEVCFKSIERIKDIIIDVSLWAEPESEMLEVFHAALELELMIETAKRIFSEDIQSPCVKSIAHMSLFLNSFANA